MKNKVYVHYLVALILFLLILLALPAGNGLTSDGVHLLAVIVPIIYMWITVGTDWVSLLALAGIVMTGVMTNGSNYYASVYSGSMGNFIILTVITCMALSEVLGQTGVIAKIANWFITRKFCQGRPYMFLAMFILSFFVIGTFMEATAAAIMYISLAQEICDKLGYKKRRSFLYGHDVWYLLGQRGGQRGLPDLTCSAVASDRCGGTGSRRDDLLWTVADGRYSV